mmetsp:Transcript_3643/g.14615  ORF Transcript_3643/g.14615 Transcript_3643/m.14615 type:complete len:213 (+) Transcript_3643:193-831(+)
MEPVNRPRRGWARASPRQSRHSHHSPRRHPAPVSRFPRELCRCPGQPPRSVPSPRAAASPPPPAAASARSRPSPRRSRRTGCEPPTAPTPSGNRRHPRPESPRGQSRRRRASPPGRTPTDARTWRWRAARCSPRGTPATAAREGTAGGPPPIERGRRARGLAGAPPRAPTPWTSGPRPSAVAWRRRGRVKAGEGPWRTRRTRRRRGSERSGA